jgi:hypothetical protein
MPPGDALSDEARVHLREIDTPAWMDGGDYVLWQDGSDYICTGIREGGLIAWRVKDDQTLQGDAARAACPKDFDWQRQHNGVQHIMDARRQLKTTMIPIFPEQQWAIVWPHPKTGDIQVDGTRDMVERIRGALEAAEN